MVQSTCESCPLATGSSLKDRHIPIFEPLDLRIAVFLFKESFDVWVPDFHPAEVFLCGLLGLEQGLLAPHKMRCLLLVEQSGCLLLRPVTAGSGLRCDLL